MPTLRKPLLSAACLAACLLGQPAAALAAAPPHAPATYCLDYGDVLDVSVTGNDPLEVKGAPIRPDGRLSLPLVGEVLAGGGTVAQLTKTLNRLYGRYLVHPSVVVNVEKFRPVEVTVLGQVNHPGTYESDKPITMLKALALAGGLVPDRADLAHVLVLDAQGHQRELDLGPLLRGSDGQNARVADGDTVTVKEVWTPDFSKVLPLIPPVLGLVTTLFILEWKH